MIVVADRPPVPPIAGRVAGLALAIVAVAIAIRVGVAVIEPMLPVVVTIVFLTVCYRFLRGGKH